MIKNLELSLSEVQDGLKKCDDGLWEIRHENLELSKELVKSVEVSFFVMQVYFENALQ